MCLKALSNIARKYQQYPWTDQFRSSDNDDVLGVDGQLFFSFFPLGPVPQMMVKFNPRLSQILTTVCVGYH